MTDLTRTEILDAIRQLSDLDLSRLRHEVVSIADSRLPEFLIVCEANEDYDPEQDPSEDAKFPEFLMTIRCPECWHASVADHAVGVQWNCAEFADDGTDATHVTFAFGDGGDYHSDGWICTNCLEDLSAPAVFDQALTADYAW